MTARFLVTAVGCLSAANVPDIPGLRRLPGRRGTTRPRGPAKASTSPASAWGSIGTGSSGIQATPVIAAQAAHLTVFQRTPNFSRAGASSRVPEPRTRRRSSRLRRDLRAHPSVARRLPLLPIERKTIDVSDEERQQILDGSGRRAASSSCGAASCDLLRDRRANEIASEFIRSKIREIVKDPATAEQLCPNDHPYGSKRPPIDTDYYVTFNRDNVSLVDISELADRRDHADGHPDAGWATTSSTRSCSRRASTR